MFLFDIHEWVDHTSSYCDSQVRGYDFLLLNCSERAFLQRGTEVERRLQLSISKQTHRLIITQAHIEWNCCMHTAEWYTCAHTNTHANIPAPPWRWFYKYLHGMQTRALTHIRWPHTASNSWWYFAERKSVWVCLCAYVSAGRISFSDGCFDFKLVKLELKPQTVEPLHWLLS